MGNYDNYTRLLIDIDEKGLAIVTNNRPEMRNALDPVTYGEFKRAFLALDEDPKVRAIILTGAGEKAFASGADLKVLRDRPFLEALDAVVQGTFNVIESVSKPVIAAIEGYALGGGCELAMACDIRIASKKSKFGQPETKFGIIPSAGGTQRLQRLVGFGKAKELILTGDIIDAEEACRLGLVNKVTENGEALNEAKEMAAKIIERAPIATKVAKACINLGANTDLQSGLMFERYAQALVFATEDKYEGTNSFLEKRPAVFQNR